jgi:hypothetical protein
MSHRCGPSRSPTPPSRGVRAPVAARVPGEPSGRSGRPTGLSILGVGALLAVALSSQAMAQSAPAGRDAGLAGYGGTRWSTDYGIAAGRCDRDAIAVEANPGGQTLVQRHEENLKNRRVGIIGATPGTGLLLSTRLGGRLDERDRRCLGHVLELGVPGRQVGWTNGGTRQAYAVAVSEYSPTSSIPSGTRPGAKERCRVLLLTTTAIGAGVGAGARGRGNTETLVACQANPGVWSIR